jgi:hypothetical protein
MNYGPQRNGVSLACLNIVDFPDSPAPYKERQSNKLIDVPACKDSIFKSE